MTTLPDTDARLLAAHEALRFEDFVKITPCVVDGEPDAHIARFKVGSQEFSLTPFASDTRAEAEWMKEMFCKALREMHRQMSLTAPGEGDEKETSNA